MSDELKRIRIREASAENLMILYVDSYREDNLQTDFYNLQSGGLGRRDAYPRHFLRQRQNRHLIRETFEGNIRWLVTHSRWQALYWLHDTFPSRHLTGAPGVPLNELRDVIRRAAQRERVGDHTGWEEIMRIPVREQIERRDRAAAARDQRRLLAEAVTIIRRELRSASGERAHFMCFSSALYRAIGGHTQMGPTNWAGALLRFVVTLNELRNGQQPSRGGPVPHAPVTITALMVEAASNTWHRQLNDDQREVLENDEQWGLAMRPIWEELQQRLIWGVREAGQDSFNLDTFDSGRWRNPPQSCF